MTADERLARIRVKVERAKKHISELNAEIETFRASNPYEVGSKPDPQTGKPIFYLMKCDPLPLHFAAIIGDSVQNLRSALEHLVQQLFMVANGTVATASHISFPTDISPAQYKINAPGKIKGLRQDAIDAINSIEPYDGGKGADLSILNRLNRIDKHRLLIMVTSTYFDDLPLRDLREMLGSVSPIWSTIWPTSASIPPLIIRAANPTIYGLKVGDQLPATPYAKTEMNQKVQFRFGIALNEPGVIEGKPLLPTLKHMADLVDNLILSFRSLLQ